MAYIPDYAKCPRCGELLEMQKPSEWQSICTRWTDGKNFEWDIHGFRDILYRGYRCGKLFWRSSASSGWEALRGTRTSDGTLIERPPFCENMDKEPYHLAASIEQGMCDELGAEIYVRMRLWWNFNDPFRPLLDPLPPEHVTLISAAVERPRSFDENARRLLELLSPTDLRERILCAELHRQLGEYDAAVALLTDTVELFYDTQEFERAQSAAEQAEVRKSMGDISGLDCSAESEVLITIATCVMERALARDSIIRPVEQKFVSYDEPNRRRG